MSGTEVTSPRRLPGPAPRRSPLARTTSAGAVYRQLHAEIVSMHLLPGAVLAEKALSERYGVSRTPIREAIIRLSEDQLVEVFPQLGTFVARIDDALIPEAVVIRQALEGATITRAAAAASSADIARLDDILAHQRFLADRNDTDGFQDADEAFHEAIAGMAGFPGIWSYLEPAKVHIDRVRRLTLPLLKRMEPVLAEHRVIRDAVAAHDVERASHAMAAHLSAVIPDLAQLRATFPDYFI